MLWREENETPGWTQLKLPGQAPSPRCGHSVTSAGHYVILISLSSFAIFNNFSFSLLLLSRVIWHLFVSFIYNEGDFAVADVWRAWDWWMVESL